MFNSGVKTSELISGLKEEVDIAIPIDDSLYISWLNSLERLLYREVIKEQKLGNGKDLQAFKAEDEDEVTFEDIHAVYVGNTQLIKSTAASGVIFPDTYYKEDNNLVINTEKDGDIKIVYFVKPKLKSKGDDSYVNMPIEFIDLVKAKLRGEAYKLANEDILAAKWLNDYNILLENFKVWISEKASNFGL